MEYFERLDLNSFSGLVISDLILEEFELLLGIKQQDD